jgi:hypothetical protein
MFNGARVSGILCDSNDCNGADPCATDADAGQVGDGFMMTPSGGWPKGLQLDQFLSFPRGQMNTSRIAAVGLCVTQRDLATEKFEIDEVTIDRVQDPIRLWSGEYSAILQDFFGGREGAIALGTDINGLAPQFPFSEFVPRYRVDDQQACGGSTDKPTSYGRPDWGGVFTFARALKIGGTALCLPSRGLATYGMLPEMFAAVFAYNPIAYRSLFRSAAATIAAWKASRVASLAFATTPGTCGVSVHGVGPCARRRTV